MEFDGSPPELGEMEQPAAETDSPSRASPGAPMQAPAFSVEMSSCTEPGTIQFLSNVTILDAI